MKQLTFLLINPWIYDFAAFDLYFKPVGLLSLANRLKRIGCRVILLDCMDRYDDYFIKNNLVYDKKYGTGKYHFEIIEKPHVLHFIQRDYKRHGLPFAEVERRLKSLKAEKIDAVLITSFMTYWYPGVVDMIRLVKKILVSTPTFLGGIYATLMKKHAIEHTHADLILTENKISSTIKDIFLYLKSDIPEVSRSISYKDEEEPLYDLYTRLSYCVVILSKGCPFHCSYCASKILQKQFKIKDTNGVIDNLKYYLNKYDINNVAFYDDALLYQFDNNLKKFLLGLRKSDIYFHTPNGLHLKFINEAVAQCLYEYQFKMIRLSLETSSVERQKRTGSKTSNREFLSAIGDLHRAGFKQKDLEVYILFGFPDQKVQEIKETIQFIKDNGGTPKIVEYSLIPGTSDYKYFIGDKYIDPLLHNNSVFFQKYTQFTIDDFSELRSLAKL